MSTPAAILCAEMSRRPCACGRRPRGDRQTVVNVATQEATHPLQGNSCLRITGTLRCDVCGNAHRAGMMLPGAAQTVMRSARDYNHGNELRCGDD